jgi:hypothetical protein
MADLQTIISENGPLPIEVTAAIETDAPTVVTLAGSVWSVDTSFMVGVQLAIDGTHVASAPIYANSAEMHMAVVPATVAYTFADSPNQEHAFALYALSGETQTDANDFFLVTVQY